MTSRLFWTLFPVLAALNIASNVIIGWSIVGFWTGAGASCAILLLVTRWIVGRIVGPMAELNRAAERMARGDYQGPIYVSAGDELGQLAQTLNRARRETDARLARLSDANQRLSTVLGSMTDGVIAIDQHQRVLFANRAAGKLMGFDPADAQGKSLLETVRNHTLHEFAVRVLASSGRQQLELAWGAAGRITLLVDATSVAGQPSAGVVMVIHNLSEVRQLEAMRRDFVANVSHELKTPLSSIKAYAETLSQGAIHDVNNRENFVRQIEQQADRLNQLISDLLSLARLESGGQALDIRHVSVANVVELCVREQQRAAEEKRIQLVAQGNGDPRVEADPDGLRQIFINLIDNAIKYTPEGGQVSVEWVYEDQTCLVRVQDNGIGIPENLQPRVFERFFRVDKARSRELGGTGLGLAIVKHLVRGFRGSVDVESEPGVGSRFSVRIPLAAE